MMRSQSISPGAGAGLFPAPSSPSPTAAAALGRPSVEIGRESVNRSQYGQLRRARTIGAHHRHATARPSLEGVEMRPPAAAAGAAVSAYSLAPSVQAGFNKEQLDEVGLLLDCYRTRASYIVGGTRVLVARRRNPLRTAVMAVYSFLANNTQPAVLAWQVPDEQLLELTLTARV